MINTTSPAANVSPMQTDAISASDTSTSALMSNAVTSPMTASKMMLDAVGIDPTYIGLIYGVDRLFDMGRTSLNVIGDASCAICVNYWEGNAKKAAAKKA